MDKSDQTLGGVDVGSPLIKQALTLSLADGCLCAVMMALADTFGVAAAVKLNAPAMAIALLGSGPLLISSLGQFFLPLFLNPKKTRKHYVVGSVRLQAVFIILAAFTGWLPAPCNATVYVAAFVLYGSSGNLFGGLWISWIRDCVPEPVRGRHFAWRNRFFNVVTLACVLSAGIVSRHLNSKTRPGFCSRSCSLRADCSGSARANACTCNTIPTPRACPISRRCSGSDRRGRFSTFA